MTRLNIKSVRTETTYNITLTQKEFDVILAVLTQASSESTNYGLEDIKSKYRIGIEDDTTYDLYCQFKRSRDHI